MNPPHKEHHVSKSKKSHCVKMAATVKIWHDGFAGWSWSTEMGIVSGVPIVGYVSKDGAILAARRWAAQYGVKVEFVDV